jgi:hypothetical protein
VEEEDVAPAKRTGGLPVKNVFVLDESAEDFGALHWVLTA